PSLPARRSLDLSMMEPCTTACCFRRAGRLQADELSVGSFGCSSGRLHGEFDPGSGRTLAACLTHASRAGCMFGSLRAEEHGPSGGRVSNTWVTCPSDGDNPGKPGLIPDTAAWLHDLVVKGGLCLQATADGWARVPLAGWWGNGLPRRRWVAGLRGWSATLGLRHGPDSYGRQQWGILDNGRKPDPATPRGGGRPSGCKPLSSGKK